MAKKTAEPTQKTRPRGKDAEGNPAKPETIPVPTRGEFFGDLEKVARPGKRLEDGEGQRTRHRSRVDGEG